MGVLKAGRHAGLDDVAYALKRGVLLLCCGMHGNALRVVVQSVASDTLIEEGFAIFEAAANPAIVEEV